MGKITELYEQRAALSTQLTALRSSFDSADEPTDEQVAQINDLRGKVDSVTAQLHRLEATRQQLADMQASIDATAPPLNQAGAGNPEDSGIYNPLTIPKPTVASDVEKQAKRGLSGRARVIYKGDAHLATIGAQFIGALKGEASCISAIGAQEVQFNAVQNTQQNNLGGFLVPSELIPTLIDLREQYGVLARTANVINVSAPTGSIPRRTGRPSAVFIGEPRTADIATGDLTFDAVNYQVKPLASFTPVTVELEQDSLINLSSLIFLHAAEDFAYTEDLCGFSGDGTSTYGGIRGIVNILEDAAYAGSTVTAGSSETDYEDLTNASLTALIGRLPEYASPEAAWFVSRYGLGAAFERLKMNAGGNTISIVESGQVRRDYAGYPINVSQVLPALTSSGTGTTALLFGNMRQSAHLFRAGGIAMARDESVRFMRAEVMYRTMQRFDFVFSERGTATTPGPLLRLKFA